MRVAVELGHDSKDFTELIASQRADELERFALDMITRPVLATDQTFCKHPTRPR